MAKLPIHEDLLQANVNNPGGTEEAYDWRFCRRLATDYGVIGIPASPFFSPNSPAADRIGPMARFAFCKKDETLLLATSRLKAEAERRRRLL